MTQEEAYFIQSAMHFIGHDCDVRDSYSGRGMYDKTTYAVVVDDITTIIPAVASLAADGEPIPQEFSDSEGYREDSMGRQVVIY